MNYIFVTDFLSSEVQGGAELTLEAIANAAPIPVKVVKSEHLNGSVWAAEGIHWIFGNYTRIHGETFKALTQAIKNKNFSYSIIEFDYKYCIARNDIIHNRSFFEQGQFGFCNCANQEIGQFTTEFFNNAKFVHFMSLGQLELVKKKLSGVHGNNFTVQWSSWNDSDLDYINELYKERIGRDTNKLWGIQQSDNWLKGMEAAVLYAKDKGLNINIIPKMPYKDFLKHLSEYEGFIFHPNAWDTCPRIVVEAKLLGLKVDINDKVQIINDPAFLLPREEMIDFLRKAGKTFWSFYN